MSQVVLITGANGGLGTAVTNAFLSTGASVVGSSRDIEQSEFPAPNFTALPCDLTSAAEARTLATSVRERLGRIDALIHIMGGFAAGTVHETDDATWARMRDINLTAAFNIFRETLPIMREQKSGRVVAVGSLAAHEGGRGIAAYAAFKNALTSLVHSVAVENRDFGITANIVLPATMDTPGNRRPGADTSRWVPPEAVANLIVFLASGKGDFVNGAAIPVRGTDL